jgi:hypothetical protein
LPPSRPSLPAASWVNLDEEREVECETKQTRREKSAGHN